MGGVDSEPYTLSAIPCLSTEKDMQMQGLHDRDQTTNRSVSQCQGIGNAMKRNEVVSTL